MDPKPLSYRLINEQTPVIFLLLSIEDTPVTSVIVQEKENTYVGFVQLAQDVKVKDLQKKITEYGKYKEDIDAYNKLSDAAKAKKGPPKEVVQPTVTITRVTHEEFPYMK